MQEHEEPLAVALRPVVGERERRGGGEVAAGGVESLVVAGQLTQEQERNRVLGQFGVRLGEQFAGALEFTRLNQEYGQQHFRRMRVRREPLRFLQQSQAFAAVSLRREANAPPPGSVRAGASLR